MIWVEKSINRFDWHLFSSLQRPIAKFQCCNKWLHPSYSMIVVNWNYLKIEVSEKVSIIPPIQNSAATHYWPSSDIPNGANALINGMNFTFTFYLYKALQFIAAPDRITIQLARPTDLFGPGPGLGLGLGALGSGSGTIGIDDVSALSLSNKFLWLFPLCITRQQLIESIRNAEFSIILLHYLPCTEKMANSNRQQERSLEDLK